MRMEAIDIYSRIEKRQNALKNATKLAESKGWIVQSFRYLTNHPLDEYLFVVMCQSSPKSIKEYVIWLYNSEDNGFYEGYYTCNRENAEKKYLSKS